MTLYSLCKKTKNTKRKGPTEYAFLHSAFIKEAARQVQQEIDKKGIMFIISQSQSMKLPYSLLKSVSLFFIYIDHGHFLIIYNRFYKIRMDIYNTLCYPILS